MLTSGTSPPRSSLLICFRTSGWTNRSQRTDEGMPKKRLKGSNGRGCWQRTVPNENPPAFLRVNHRCLATPMHHAPAPLYYAVRWRLESADKSQGRPHPPTDKDKASRCASAAACHSRRPSHCGSSSPQASWRRPSLSFRMTTETSSPGFPRPSRLRQRTTVVCSN